jgi:hypothetical protein
MTYPKQFYFISKEKISDIPLSLNAYKDTNFFIGESKQEKNYFHSKCNTRSKKLLEFLDMVEFKAASIIYVENGDDSLMTEFILNEKFDAIFCLDTDEAEKNLNFVCAYLSSFNEARNSLERAHGYIKELDSYVQKYANEELNLFFDKSISDISNIYHSIPWIRESCISYLKPDVIKFLKF